MSFSTYNVNLYQGTSAVVALSVNTVTALPSSTGDTTGDLTILTQAVGTYSAGWYISEGTAWQLLVPYTTLDSSAAASDTLNVYTDVLATITPATGAHIYRNGSLYTTGTTIVAGT